MKNGICILILTLRLIFVNGMFAQLINSVRSIDWSSAGVTDDIPTRTTVFESLGTPGKNAGFAQSVTAAQINAAISSCPAGQVVYLNPGTYDLSDNGIIMTSNVTLRGAGADQTILILNVTSGCGGLWATVCFAGSEEWTGYPTTQPGGSNTAEWTSGFTKGTTQITLSNVGSSGLTVGQYIFLDQANDTTDNGNFFVADQNKNLTPCSLEGGAPGRTINGIDRNQIQIVQITGIKNGVYTISPGLYSPNWRSSQNPGVWWPSSIIQYAGVENMSIQATDSAGEYSTIGMENSANCWVKGCRLIRTLTRNHIWFYQSAHNTVRDCYFFGSHVSSEAYGIESFMSSDNLAVNNIFQQVTAPIVIGPALGSVFAYNYSINDTSSATNWMMASEVGHDAGVEYILLEGNVSAEYLSDVYHGTQDFVTLFRNRLTGWERGKTESTAAIGIWSYNRYLNIIGNVLGEPGFSSVYQTSLGVSLTSGTIYDLGSGNTEGSVVVPSDSMVAKTLMRWGNYDVVNNAVQWNASEVPSGLNKFGNPVPGSKVLPASLYLTIKPSWWGTMPWPAIGPDITGGDITGVAGHAYRIPSEVCYESMGGSTDGTGKTLSFNSDKCYGVTTTGVKEKIVFDNPVVVYPNPVQDKIYFDGSSLSSQLLVSIYTSNGKLIAKKILDFQSDRSIDVSDFVPGLYFVQIVNGDFSTTQKIVVGK